MILKPKQNELPKTAHIWSETHYYADCPHCGHKNDLDADKCMSGAEEIHICVHCQQPFYYRHR